MEASKEERLKKALLAVEKLSENDYEKLRKLVGVGSYLYRLVADFLNDPLKEDLKVFDKYGFEKKVAILNFLRELLERKLRKPKVNKNRKVKPFETFLTPLEKVDFLSPKEVRVLKSLGIRTVLDALYYFPYKYKDRRLNKSVRYAKPGSFICVKVKVLETKKLPEGDLYNYEVVTTDGTDTLKLKFRYKNFRALLRFKRGSEWIVCGKLKQFAGEKYLVHPELYSPSSEEVGRIVPVYYARRAGQAEEIASAQKRKVVTRAVANLVKRFAPYFPEVLPAKILEREGFPTADEAFLSVHFPPSTEDLKELEERRTPYQRRFIYEDLLLLNLALLLQKGRVKGLKAPKVEVPPDFVDRFEERLPFRLTGAQRRVLKEILDDMGSERPMNRLLQGDVGSGKTVVAVGATLAAVKAGYQVAVMAPTEILAQQHFKNFQKILVEGGFLRPDRIVLLTGSLPQSVKRKVKQLIRAGAVDVVIGTHALLQDDVEFKNLGLVVIDEQHRFGVLQRKALLEKGKGKHPHTLVMTATPIPRTLALAVYGDLDVSVIDEMPAGRKPVHTKLLYEDEKERLKLLLRRELEKGNKVYVIYPLIEESEKLNLKAATEEVNRWKELFPDRKVLLLHGRMKDSEKQKVMEEFKRDGDILVSTTVVEVGVDVPEATVMVIEDAHRFGLAQLHQLRGRVGRSDRQSYCFLVVPTELREETHKETRQRLDVFVKNTDGFKIAEADLQMRGSGNLLGTEQSGNFFFPMADLGREADRRILEKAREDAERILKVTPDLEKLPDLKKLLFYRYGDRLELGSVS
ncbi:MAG: ATP-dependent DNA helicase RecG [Aquificae bacterium]|nr:ATP-dependent DNA helicase RecG [Aquificota bacterium]